MNIIYEDNEIVVCEKPVGFLCEATGTPNMIDALKEDGHGTVYPVHRLDTPVSGIMVYAKTKDAAAVLCRAVAERTMQKEYLAVVSGVPDPAEGEYRDLLFKDSRAGKSYVVSRMRRGVKEASLTYRVLGTLDNPPMGVRSLVWIRLGTGRTHQIRVQFSSRGLPLIGDGKYGGKSTPIAGIALSSYALSFSHPRTGDTLSFTLVPSSNAFFDDFSAILPTGMRIK